MSMTLSAISAPTATPMQMARRMMSSPVLAANVAAVMPAPDFRRFNLYYAVFPPQLYVQLRDPDTGEVTFQAPNEASVKRAEATAPVRDLLPDPQVASDDHPNVDQTVQMVTAVPAPAKREAPMVTPRGDALNTSA